MAISTPIANGSPEALPQRTHPAVLVMLALAVVMVLTVLLALWHLRRDTIANQTRSLSSLASASADELERGLQGVLLALQATRDDLREERLRPGQAEATAQLHRRASILTVVRKLWVVNPAGEVLIASSPTDVPAVSSFIPALSDLGVDVPALSEPYVDMASHEISVAAAMRFLQPDGTPGGWVVAAMPAASLLGAFPAAKLAPDARLAVYRNDGMRLAGTLMQHEHAGAGAGAAPALAASAPDAALITDEPIQSLSDGTERLVQQRTVNVLELRLVMTRDMQTGLTRWRSTARVLALAVAAVLLVVGVLLWRMLRAEHSRQHAQQRLQEEREHAALAYAAAKEGNWDWDPRSQSFYLSPRMKELLGLPRKGSSASHTMAEVTSRLKPADAAQFQAALQGGQAGEAAPLDLVLQARHEDGQWHAVRLRGTAAHEASGRILRLAGVASDVTVEQERAAHTRRLEQKLARTQKLDALGALAGGVAHDFNSILAAVMGYSEMARQAAPEGSAQARHLDQVLQAAQRGKAVIERILTFGRGGVRPATVFAVQPVIEQVLDLLAGLMGPQVRIVRDLAAKPLYLRGDTTALFEAVMNLGTNALQAMPEGGVLTVSARPCDFSTEHWTSHGSLPAGAYARIEVADTGQGVAPEIMERLFEPFFTTRGQAGTGLGLAVVHGVAAELGGEVDVSSAPGKGSSFALFLPRVDADGVEPVEVTTRAAPPEGQGQCVLVVDDEPALVELAEELLARLGYEPVGFSEPLAALAALEAEPQRFDLLITDEVMPGLQGTELARRARVLRSDMPIMMVSGYGGTQLAQRAREAGIDRLLAKPLRPDELARAVAETLQLATRALRV